MIDFRKYLKQKSPSYFGFREIEPEELRTIFSKNSGYAKLVGGIECFSGDEKEFFVLKDYTIVGRFCFNANEVLEGDSWMAKKLYFLNVSDMLEFMKKVEVYSDLHTPFHNYRETAPKATKKPLILLVKEDAKF